MRTATIAAAILETLENRTLFDGQWDTNWGPGGVVEPQFSEHGVHNLEVAPGGRVVAFGHSVLGVGYAAQVFTEAGDTQVEAVLANDSGLAAIQPDGRYIIAGQRGTRQYAADGTLIRTFSGGHLSPIPSGKEERFRDVIVAPDGDIIVSGAVGTSLLDAQDAVIDWLGFEVYSAEGQFKHAVQNPVGYQLGAFGDGRVLAAAGGQIACYLPTGQLDPTFGNAGVITIGSGSETIRDVMLDKWGRIHVWWTSGTNDLVTRFKPSGLRDKLFGTNGTVLAEGLNLNGTLGSLQNQAITISPEGVVYVAEMINAGNDNHVAVGRFTQEGRKDLAWGAGGAATADITAGDITGGQARDIVVLPDGDVVVGAVDRPSTSNARRAKLVRFDGPDPAPAVPQLRLHDSRLTITGTAGNDVILVRSNAIMGWTVTVNGRDHVYDALEVQTISVAGGDGVDYIDARDLLLPIIPGIDFLVTIEGGDGDDILVGHAGRDRITGNDGNDKIHGWHGDDWLSGNAQKDRITGGNGNDTCLGNGARDFLVGEAGNDTLLGGDQPDTLLGMDGDDSVLGEGGHDRLYGGAGRDYLSGGGGNDWIYARDNAIDHVVGGAAYVDRAQVDEDDEVIAIEERLA